MKVIHLVRFTSFAVFLFGLVCLSQDTAVAESTTFTVNNTTTVLELTVPSVATINLNPTSGTGFDTAEVVVESGTNNSTGYVLTMSVPNTNLTNSGVTLSNPTVPVDASNHPIIPTLASGSYSVSDFTTNAWGYKLGSASNYSPVPSSVELVNTNSAANASTVTLNFAAKVDTSRYTGTYSTAINFTAVTKAPPVYTFDDVYALAGKTKHNGYYAMQDGNSAICSLVTTGQTGVLIDTRDNTTYNVGKLNDGNCWLLDNLALDLTAVDLATLKGRTNATNTSLEYLKGVQTRDPASRPNGNYPTGAVDKAWTSSSQNYFSIPMIALDSTTSGTCNNAYCVNDPTSGNWSYDSITQATINGRTSVYQGKIGIYYNYCAASAGSYCYGDGTDYTGSPESDPDTSTLQDVKEDICPAGWRLPTGDTGGEFDTLYTQYGSDYTSFQTALHTPLSGYFYVGRAYSQGYWGLFWSSTWSSTNGMRGLLVGPSLVSPSTNNTRYTGLSIRCLLSS